MESLKNITWTPLTVAKAVGLFLLALIALSIIFRLMSPIVGEIARTGGGFSGMMDSVAPSYTVPMYDRGYATDDAYSEQEAYGEDGNAKLSLRNMGVPVPEPDGSVGGDAEEYEVTEYTASIETQNSDTTCAELSELKAFEYVIFEHANEYDRGCNYTFKVEHERVAEVVATIEELNPKNLSERTYTIKNQLDDFTSEEEILKEKLVSIDETLTNAVNAYDEIAVLATRTQDAESLGQIINNKITLIERLTEDRIRTTAQLERLSRAKAEQLDRLVYTYFHVEVYENKIVDGESLRESWKSAFKGFVRDVNQTLQDISINLVAFLFVLVQYILYFVIVLVIAKYLWRGTRHFWKK